MNCFVFFHHCCVICINVINHMMNALTPCLMLLLCVKVLQEAKVSQYQNWKIDPQISEIADFTITDRVDR